MTAWEKKEKYTLLFLVFIFTSWTCIASDHFIYFRHIDVQKCPLKHSQDGLSVCKDDKLFILGHVHKFGS